MKPWPALAVVTVAAGAAVLLTLRRRYAVVTVRGHSMAPTLRDGEHLLVRRGATPAVGDLVVFAAPVATDVTHLVKRVAALAGDPVPADLRGAVTSARVPPGTLLVRGDAELTQDSRHFGAVVAGAVLGVVRRRLPGWTGR